MTSRQGLYSMRLALLDAIACDGTQRAKGVCFFLHFDMPDVIVELAGIQEHAQLRNRFQFGFTRLHQISGKRGDGLEVLRMRGSYLECGDPSVRGSRDVE